MNIKDLIEAAKFQVSVKPQDEFMTEVAERLETLYEKNNIQQKTIEKLQELLNGWKEEAYKLSDNYDKAKNEAVKEFAERLKKSQRNLYPFSDEPIIDCKDVDNLVKEMVDKDETPSTENNFFYNRFMKKE